MTNVLDHLGDGWVASKAMVWQEPRHSSWVLGGWDIE